MGNNPERLTDLFWEISYIDVYSEVFAPNDSEASTTPEETTVPEALSTTAARQNGTFLGSRASGRPRPVSGVRTRSASASTETGTATTKTASSPSSANSPVDSIVPIHNPPSIDVYSYLGCFSSISGFSSFNLAGTDPALTLEKCVGL